MANKHRFFHMGDHRGGIRCMYCDVERILKPAPIGFRWILNRVEFVKKPKCIPRKKDQS